MPELKLQSIKGKKLFAQMYESGKRFSNDRAGAIIEFRRPDDPTTDLILYAVICSKKTARKAVVRNRIKRLLRVAVRSLLSSGTQDNLMSIGKLIVSWREAPARPGMIGLGDVEPAISDLFKKIEKYITHNRTTA